MRCVNSERGCDWQGTVGGLDDHVTKCGFTLVSCPNMCMIEHEESQVMRNDLNDHLKTKCLNRDYKCKHCGEKGTYASITEVHDGVCILKVVPCPHNNCTLTMERGLAKKHVQTVCKYTVVACKYATIGCSVQKLRMDMNQHEEDDKSHLSLTRKEMVKLENTISSQMATISSLENAISMLKEYLCTFSRDNSITFNLPWYSLRKVLGITFFSEPFHTSPGGYKMCFRVHPNGYGTGKGTHVSFFLNILKGPYDDKLPWPFLGTVTLYLLNQSADDNNHRVKLLFDTACNARVGSAWGYPIFLSHTKVSNDQDKNIRYLMAETLYFRVTVKVDHHKPWLDCSHPTPQKTTSPANLTPK